ncbi:MAG: DUF4440 domain-containing protein [Chloroflexi bacterium]|nr:DUF4440 domain-containing protein [Chloroflexota bacterium]
MEASLVTEPGIVDILNELIQLEQLFHRPDRDMTRADFEVLIETSFREVGASGRPYSREQVLDELEKRCAHQTRHNWETRDCHCLEIASDNYLLTYTLRQGNRVTRRSTIWRQTSSGWKMVYHQGTIVADT